MFILITIILAVILIKTVRFAYRFAPLRKAIWTFTAIAILLGLLFLERVTDPAILSAANHSSEHKSDEKSFFFEGFALLKEGEIEEAFSLLQDRLEKDDDDDDDEKDDDKKHEHDKKSAPEKKEKPSEKHKPKAELAQPNGRSEGSPLAPMLDDHSGDAEHVSVKVSDRPFWVNEGLLIERADLPKLTENTIPSKFVVVSGRWSTHEEANQDAEKLLKEVLALKAKGGSGTVANLYNSYLEPHTLTLPDGTEAPMCRVYLQASYQGGELVTPQQIRQESGKKNLFGTAGVLLVMSIVFASASLFSRT